MSKPQRQHYISRFLIRQWAEDGKVGVVCTYHRRGATVPDDKLHWVHSLSSREQESAWSDDIENPAKLALDRLVESLGPRLEDYEAAKEFLSEPGQLELLIDLARLHHARALAVPTQQFVRSQGTADSAEAEAMIRERWEGTQDYHDFGAVITVLSAGSPYALGAVPVFDTETWGPRDKVKIRYMMPLTPRVTISGALGLSPRQVEIGTDDIGHKPLLQLAGQPGLFATQWMICEPSALDQTTRAVLDLSEGGGTHWFALGDRIELCDNASREIYANWQRRCDTHANNQLALETRELRESVVTRIHNTRKHDARKIQADLDALDAPVCKCGSHRNGVVGALWRRFMPQVICDAIRDQRRA